MAGGCRLYWYGGRSSSTTVLFPIAKTPGFVLGISTKLHVAGCYRIRHPVDFIVLGFVFVFSCFTGICSASGVLLPLEIKLLEVLTHISAYHFIPSRSVSYRAGGLAVL